MRLLVQVQPGLPAWEVCIRELGVATWLIYQIVQGSIHFIKWLFIKFENLKKILYNIYIINELLKLNNNLITVIVQLSADLTP